MRRARSEAGASLILALAMVTMISVALVGALGYATTSLRTVAAISSQRASAYAADGGVQTAIQALRASATAGTTAAGTACPTTSYAAVGVQPAVAVTCQVVAPRGTGVAGVSMPPYAIWAVGSSAAEPGIIASPALEVNGPIASNSPANGAGSVDSIEAQTTIDASGYTVDATGTCAGTVTVATPADKHCSTGLSYPDPGYPSQTLPALSAPNPDPTCTVTNGVLQFAPGYYTDTAEFETPVYLQGGNTCKTGYLYFKPGVYYFDYSFDPAFTDATWTVSGSQFIVGGEYKNWNPNTANSFPAPPGGGASVACKTGDDGATSGVQFVFGGASHWKVQTAAKVEICADPTPTGTSQQIAVYGETGGTDPAPQSTTRVPTTATPTPSTGWTGLPTKALAIDAQVASYTMPSGATDSVALGGFVGASALVAGAVNVSYALEVSHQETTSAATNISSLAATIGTTCALVPTKHNTTSLSAPVTDTFALTTTACIAAVQSNFTVTFKGIAASSKTFVENLDGISLVVTYTPSAMHPQSGCVADVNGTCSFLNFGSSGPQIVLWGTVYAPAASVFVDDANGALIEFRRGVVARMVKVSNVPVGDSTGGFCLGGGSPCSGQTRVLMYTATVAGGVRIRALVQYTDTPALGTAVQILSWNVLRG